jgi:hypothetical protein
MTGTFVDKLSLHMKKITTISMNTGTVDTYDKNK